MFREIRIREIKDEAQPRTTLTKAEQDWINNDIMEMMRALGLTGPRKIIDINEEEEKP